MLQLVRLTDQVPRDHDPLDLVGALVDLEDLRVPEELGDRIVLHEAVASEHLDGIRRDLHRHIRGEALRHRRHLRVRRARTVHVDPCRSGVGELAGGLGLHRHVRQHLLDHLVLTNRHTKLHAAVRVHIGEVEGTLRRTDRLGRHAGTRVIERHHRVLEAEPLAAADEIGGRHSHIVEVGLHHRHAADAHLVLDLRDGEARRALLDDEGADPTGLRGRIRHGEDGVNVRHAAVGRPLLLAVDDVVVAVADGANGEAAGVRACELLRQAEGDEGLARRDLRQPLLLLLLGATEQDREGAKGVHRVGDAEARIRLGQLLGDERQRQDACVQPSVLLWNPGPKEPGASDCPGRIHVVFRMTVGVGRARADDVIGDLAGDGLELPGLVVEDDVLLHD